MAEFPSSLSICLTLFLILILSSPPSASAIRHLLASPPPSPTAPAPSFPNIAYFPSPPHHPPHSPPRPPSPLSPPVPPLIYAIPAPLSIYSNQSGTLSGDSPPIFIPKGGKGHGLGAGAIAGIVIAVLAGVGLVAVVGYVCLVRSRNLSRRQNF
eukprot:TRINITY_DN36000_c0_g1_i1.p1 TRINITY_DN36000_c0_g1~~TRINITY_DN36000_c0_g1_i1.p1  ORF type:complete len:154 (-),score=17.34 TRINITY_DN36000_c0_g1_i1:709-1170(-)